MLLLDHSLSSLRQFSPESPSWSLSSCHGTGSQTMTSVKRLGDNALLTWHLGTVAMDLQASLLLQKVEAQCRGQWKSEMVQEGLLWSLLWPLQAPLFSRAPSESKSSPSREGDALGSSAVPCQCIEKSTSTPSVAPLLGRDQDRSLEGFEGIYRDPKPHGYGCRKEGTGVLYKSSPKEK